MASYFTIDKVWSVVQRMAQNHNVQRLDTEDFNSYATLAHYQYYDQVYGRPSEMEGYETEPQISDALLPFKASSTITLTSGEGTKPTDYLHKRSVYYFDGAKKVKVKPVTDEQWDYYHDNSVYTPTTRDPIWNFKNNTTIRVSPNSIASIEFYYLKRGDEPAIAFTSSNGILSYDSGSSTDFLWDDDHIINIIRIMLSYLSIEAGRSDILQYVEQKEEIES
jgi:hypothetical protein